MEELPQPLETVGMKWRKQERQLNMFFNMIVLSSAGFTLLIILISSIVRKW